MQQPFDCGNENAVIIEVKIIETQAGVYL